MVDWIHISTESGTGNAIITVTADSSTQLTERLTQLTITTFGGKQKTLNIVQDAHIVPYLNVSPTSIEFYKEGGVATINVHSNVCSTVSVSGTPVYTSIFFQSLRWTIDVPASGGTADKDNCAYTIWARDAAGESYDVTNKVTISGSLNVPSSMIESRHSAGTLTLTANYNSLSTSGEVTVYQEAYVSPSTDNQIIYVSTDGNKVELYSTSGFGGNFISNTYAEGEGLIIFDNTVTSIGNNAFRNCKTLFRIDIPDTVRSIGESAFYSCQGIKDIVVPYGVTSIGREAFQGCYNLISIDLPDTITSIGQWAFYYCGFKRITIPPRVTSIENFAFSSCFDLEQIRIHDNITSIGKSAFNGCGITKAVIGRGVNNIGLSVFGNCNSLEYISFLGETPATLETNSSGVPTAFDSENEYPLYVPYGSADTYKNAWPTYAHRIQVIPSLTYTSTNGSVFEPSSLAPFDAVVISNTYRDGVGTMRFDTPVTEITMWAFADESDLASIQIPPTVKLINNYAFDTCSNLTSVTIPNSVTKIEYGVFENCSSLTGITIPSSVTSIGTQALVGCTSLTSIVFVNTTPPSLGFRALHNTNECPIYVPAESVDTYKSAWGDYRDRIQAIP